MGLEVALPEGRSFVGSGTDCVVRVAESSGLAAEHLELELQRDHLMLYDLEGGALVNGARVERSAELVDGDLLQVGSVQLVVRAPAGSHAR